MPEIRKVSVALTAEQVAVVQAAVSTGEYATASEVVREALRDWQWKRELHEKEIGRLRSAWRRGKASGKAGVVDFADVRNEARRRLRKSARNA